MTATKPATVAGQRVLSYVERVEKLLEERKAIGADIRDIFTEAKGNGYDVKTLRKLVQIRAIDAAERDEANALLDTYASAIGMEVGTFAKEPDEEDLIERAAKIIREVDLCATHLVAMDGKPPKIEAIKSLIGCSTGKAHKLRTLVIERMEGFSSSERESVKTGNEKASGNSAHEGEDDEQRYQLRPVVEGHDQGSREGSASGNEAGEAATHEAGAVGSLQRERVASIQEELGCGGSGDFPGLSGATATPPPPQPLSYSTGDEGLEVPSFLRRVRV